MDKLFVALSCNHGIIDIDEGNFMTWLKADIKNINHFNYINETLSAGLSQYPYIKKKN